MSISAEQLAAELAPFAAKDYVQLPPLPPAKPAAPAPAAAAAPGAAAPAPAPVAPPPPPPAPPSPIQVVEHAAKGVNLDACVEADKVVEVASLLAKHGFAMDMVTGMDWLAQGLMEVVYDYLDFKTGLRVCIRARLPRDNPKIATISEVFSGANWHERETHDFFGIVFTGHPDLTPFLLPEDATYHPLRKDYQP